MHILSKTSLITYTIVPLKSIYSTLYIWRYFSRHAG